MVTNSEISFYVDTMIVETIVGNTALSKVASEGVISGLLDKVKSYVMAHIDPNDKAGSIINILAPGAVSMLFRSMGMGGIGLLVSLAMSTLGIDVGAIVKSIWNQLKPSIAGDKQTNSATVDSAVQAAVQEHAKPASAEEAAPFLEGLAKRDAAQDLRDAKIVRLALIEYESQLLSLRKDAGVLDMLPGFNKRRGATANVLSRILSWVFKVALASAGLMVAGDVVNKYILGRPNALDGSLKDGKPTEISSGQTTSQKKFPVNPSYRNQIFPAPWSIPMVNNKQNIENLIVSFAKEVYSGLDSLDSVIKNTAGFQVVRDKIVNHNYNNLGDPMIFMPPYFNSKKQIVDFFIDDVAENAP